MARRDVGRHRGRSLLVVVMVGLPVLLLTAGSTLWFTNDLDTAERLPLQLGRTQAFVFPPQPSQLRQFVDPASGGWDEASPAALPLPGLPAPTEREHPASSAASPGDVEASVEALLGAELYALASGPAEVEVDGHYSLAVVLAADLSRPEALAPRLALESGRWPRAVNEVTVTVRGLERGLPRSGTMNLTAQGTSGPVGPSEVTVVGVARAFDSSYGKHVEEVDLVATQHPDGIWAGNSGANRQWLVDRPTPMTWADIERLNTYGITAYSRYVALHPETAMARPADQEAQDDVALFVVGAAALGLLLLTTLLAGPAFAVSAARQRHGLALAASNGATTAQLRRSVLGQALVLGALSAVVGAALGVVTGVGAVTAIRFARPDLVYGPLDIPWPAVLAVAGAAIVSSVVAALIPSRGLARLDIVSVLRGQSVSPRLRRRVPVAGAVLTAVGAVVVTWSSFGQAPRLFLVFVAGCVVLVVGALMLVPLALAAMARLAHRLPLPLRMAAREAGRQRGRATPTVAAIMAGAAVLAVVAVALQADTERRARDHTQLVLPGQGMIEWGISRPAPRLVAALEQSAPRITTVTLHRLSDYDSRTPTTMLVAQRPGCSLAETTRVDFGSQPGDDTRCITAASNSPLPGGSLAAASLEELDRFLDLTEEQRAALSRGAVAVLDPTAAADLPRPSLFTGMAQTIDRHRPVDVDVKDGEVTFARFVERLADGDMPVAPSPDDVAFVEVPVVHLSHDQWMRTVSGWLGGPAGLMTTQTATRLGATLEVQTVLLRSPDGISADLEARLNDVLRSNSADTSLLVERGFQRDDALALAILFGVIGLVILVATLIATALSQAENAPLLGTLAAVGATRRTRRALAGAQALYLGLLGAALGVAVGLVPGVAIARLLLTTWTEGGLTVPPSSIDVPWLQVLLPLLSIPLVAGALAWASIRTAPVVTRRVT